MGLLLSPDQMAMRNVWDWTHRTDTEGQSHFPDRKQCANWTEILVGDPMTWCRRTVAADLSTWTSKLSISNSNTIPELLLERVLLDCGGPDPGTWFGWLELRDKVVTHVAVAGKWLEWRRTGAHQLLSLSPPPTVNPRGTSGQSWAWISSIRDLTRTCS